MEVKEEQKLLMCPEEGCHRTFQRYGTLQNHMLYGRHEKKQEKIALTDRAKKGYARRLEMQYGVVPSKTSASILLEEENDKGMGTCTTKIQIEVQSSTSGISHEKV